MVCGETFLVGKMFFAVVIMIEDSSCQIELILFKDGGCLKSVLI